MTEILLETNKGIVFEKETGKKRCKVVVKNSDAKFNHMIYRFSNIVMPFTSPFLSWENLNCCNGWVFDSTYLLSAVQEGKKLCSGITFSKQTDLDEYKNGLNQDCKHFCCPPTHNGPYTFYHIDVVRDGAICDYIDEHDILKAYNMLGITSFNKEILLEMLKTPMLSLISSESFSYANPQKVEDAIVTGLLLGYPIESTAWLIESGRVPT